MEYPLLVRALASPYSDMSVCSRMHMRYVHECVAPNRSFHRHRTDATHRLSYVRARRCLYVCAGKSWNRGVHVFMVASSQVRAYNGAYFNRGKSAPHRITNEL